MKKSTIATLILVAVLIAANCLTFVFADNVPGSSADPVVTKSYVDSLFNSLKAQLESGEYTVSEAGSGTVSAPVAAPAASNEFVVLSLSKGEKVIGESGTEIILRSGSASAIGANGVGVTDVTAGTDLKDGVNISANHLLIVPRTDGRGISITKDAFVMVRGAYTVK